jgi:hypothetical protein
MNFKSSITLKNALYITPIVFFSGFCIFILWFFLSIWPLAIRTKEFHWIYNAVFLLFYLISFCGSLKLLHSFPEKPTFRKYFIPFCLVTASGILFSIIRFVSSVTVYEWPLAPIADLLLTITFLLLAPAITILMIPFILEMDSPPKISVGILAVISLISAGIVFQILVSDILPIFDPEFIWSGFWDFGSAHFDTTMVSSGFWHFGNANPLTDILSSLYLVFGMLFIGLISISIIKKFLISNSLSERGS